MQKTKPKRRQELELAIEKVAFGGKGVARVNDFVVFVEKTLPGDVVIARIRKVRSKYAEAYPLEILTPSPLRQDAPCSHFGHCGGCKWQNVAYEEQLRIKQEHVLESIRHVGKIEPEIVHPVIPSPNVFGYRNKMEFSFSDNRWLTPEELKNPEIKKGYALGLHVPGFFDRVMNIDYCYLQDEVFNRILRFSHDFFKDAGVTVYNVHRKDGLMRYLVLRKSEAFNKIMVNVVTYEKAPDLLSQYTKTLTAMFPEVASIFNTINSRSAQIATGDERVHLYGDPVLMEKLGDFVFEVSPDSFFQTNSVQAETLYNIVADYAEVDGANVWDMYSGTGSIAIFLASRAKHVVGFEIVENAVRDAYRNAELNSVNNCEFVPGDIRHNLREYSGPTPDVIICDPPRAGMHPDVLREINRVSPQQIVYVSCNPTTMARDLGELIDNYILTEVQPVDMFPHTYHIESVARLQRREFTP